jgi:hypothetical protein
MKLPWNRKKDADDAVDPARLEAQAYVTELAWEALVPGFQDKDDIIESISEMADDDDNLALTGAEAAAMVETLWQKRLIELQQPAERDPSDDVRVAAAFAELESSGVIARMNLGYDQGEGSDEAREIAKAAGARGFVYFHIQDANRLAYPDATLYLGWDAVGTTREEYDAASIRIGEEIRAAMERQGLTVNWDGTLASRPAVSILDWRRPLPA